MALLLPVSASANSFTFESTPAGFYQSSLSVTNGGLTLTATPEGDPNGFLDIANPNVGLLGSLSLIGSQTNPLQGGRFDPVRFTFSQTVGAITFAFGDAGGDSDSPVTINAYNAGGTLLGTLTTDYPADFADGKTLSGNFPGASYFILNSGSDIGNENSIFWEVTSVDLAGASVPEPASITLALLGVGTFAGTTLARRRRRTEISA